MDIVCLIVFAVTIIVWSGVDSSELHEDDESRSNTEQTRAYWLRDWNGSCQVVGLRTRFLGRR